MLGNHMLGDLKRIVKEQALARSAWIEAASDPKLVRTEAGVMSYDYSLNREITTFRRVLPSLTREEGKFAVIVGDILIGVFDAYEDALKTGQQKAQSRSFLVKKIPAAESI